MATFHCKPPKGEPEPKVLWHHESVPLQLGGRISGAENGDLIIKSVMVADAGKYTCLAINKGGEKESPPAVLTVLGEWRLQLKLEYFVKILQIERDVLFNDALNTFYLRLYGVRHMVKEREMFYLTTHSTHCMYGYMASDIWLRTILIVRKETCCRHIGYSYRLTARVLLYAPSHRQDSTYHGLCFTSRGALAGTRNSSMGPPHEGSIRRPTAP